ncbi:hypothetical protein BOO71_0011317 [Deinococcus marmoris]|uniref:Uncharacterized protein n=1 Tax=Deinococcus marmoris TaxID=249408 RepID=A0A1U7NUT6_9DEIO|nr:hypothetical protein BOO71_0011317 [Deinococcus marmoris]
MRQEKEFPMNTPELSRQQALSGVFFVPDFLSGLRAML